MIRLKFEIGLFDEPFGDVELAVLNNGSEKHRELALETARQSLVLLKNENNTLPLDAKKVKKLLVVGARAEEVDLGGYSGTPKKLVSILEGLEHALPGTEVVFHPGVQSAPTPFMYMPKSMINEGLGFEAKFYENGELSTPSFTTHLEILRVRRFILRNHNYPKTVFSSEISGSFVSDQNRDAKLEIEATGEVHVFVNGEEILNNVGTIGEKDTRSDANFGELSGSIDQGLPKYSASYYFEKGSEYSIDVKWTNSDSDPTLFLRWDQRYGLEETIAEAVDLAKSSDAVVMVPSGIFEGEFQDRPNLDLPDEEEALIHALADSGTLLSVVLVNGSAITMMDWESRVLAILESWYSGQEGGNAIAEVLIGDYNPGGKLTITFPKYSWQCPLYYNYHPIGRSRGYQGPEKGKSLFPFGHGLSYTNFEYRDLSFSSKKINLDEGIDVSFKVKNTGRVKGDEVAQLYIWDEIASVVRPNKELKGFQRVTLEPGQEKLVTLHLSPEELSLWDREMNFKMEAGWTTVLVGSSSEDIRLRDRFEIVP
ncbi:MAG: glycoside hydrolase family 3 C-terminal domain-containing protein [Opitutales bacterium]|nr:glycoside hydrolase family 3 C-terminal domain-containing protein [Opitutales bacterium]